MPQPEVEDFLENFSKDELFGGLSLTDPIRAIKVRESCMHLIYSHPYIRISGSWFRRSSK